MSSNPNNPAPAPGPFSRRRFLSRTTRSLAVLGTGLAFPDLFLNHTRAATGENPSNLIRIGFIGVGGRGFDHLQTMIRQAAAVCDVDGNHLARAAKAVEQATGSACRTCTDYRRILEDKNIDAVCISTPDHWHALPAIEACEAGKDVYCEKPLTLTIEEGIAMCGVVRRTKRILQTGSQQRSDAKFRLAVDLVRNGMLGTIRRVDVRIPGPNYGGVASPARTVPPQLDYEFWLGPAPFHPYDANRVHYNFRFFWDYSGGQMTNWGAHHLDIAQWALNMDGSGPVEISGSAKYDPQRRFDVPTWSQIDYTYASGIKMSCLMDGGSHVRFEGSSGSLTVSRGNIESAPESLLDEALKDPRFTLKGRSSHHQDWLDCIKSRKDPISPVESGHRSATLCHLGNIATLVGRKIRWDPVKERILDDAEASQRTGKAYRAPWKLPGN